MSDSDHVLTPADVQQAAPEGWRQIMRRLQVRYRTGSYATGATLVARIGEVAVQAGGEPTITLTADDVLVVISGSNASGITEREIALARLIAEVAQEVGAQPDVEGITAVELALDTVRSTQNAPVYAALLGVPLVDGEPVDPTGQVPTIWWQGAPEDGVYPELPEPGVEQRWHLDVWVPIDEGPRRVAAVLAAGGRLVSEAAAPAYWVLEDVDGNRSCVCTSAARPTGDGPVALR